MSFPSLNSVTSHGLENQVETFQMTCKEPSCLGPIFLSSSTLAALPSHAMIHPTTQGLKIPRKSPAHSASEPLLPPFHQLLSPP